MTIIARSTKPGDRFIRHPNATTGRSHWEGTAQPTRGRPGLNHKGVLVRRRKDFQLYMYNTSSKLRKRRHDVRSRHDLKEGLHSEYEAVSPQLDVDAVD